MKAVARLKREIWCMDLAYIDILAKDDNGEKKFLAREDLLERAVDAKRVETKDSLETVVAILNIITNKNRPRKNWVDRG